MGGCICKNCRSSSRSKKSSKSIDHKQSRQKKKSKRVPEPQEIELRPINHGTQYNHSSSIPVTDGEHFNQPKKIINVLLLGESGVGKSTFINAIVNYLTFDDIEEAQSKTPIALMPVSFLMTIGDDFEEKMVQFGEKDSNENHNDLGQSVTQRCKSYTFDIGTKTKLNLIDTPGMGDTRGLDQDDLNMHHILSFINDLPHLNAICILLKPNESRLNVVLRSYFTRLLSFLGENIRHNIIFCFTNTRATFFAPGNTGPLLKKMLASHSIKDVPYEKTNTFCFDSESFRYLVARLNGVKFDDFQKEEYKRSWTMSVNESNRFLRYICSELKPFPQKSWCSFEHAQFQINKMIRPILETIRNLYRNIIILTECPSKPQLELIFTPVSLSSTICNKCNRYPQLYSVFYILLDELHICVDECTRCKCSRKRHLDINYRLDYEVLKDETSKRNIDEMSLNFDRLKRASVDFGYFLLRISQKSEPDDPISSYLDQMIHEEHKICQSNDIECLNLKLYTKLNQFKEEYEQKRNTLMIKNDPIDLTDIYQLLQTTNEMDIMRGQIKVSHQFS